jgi:hypothetical protein
VHKAYLKFNSIEKQVKVKDSKLPCKETGRWVYESICNSAGRKGWTKAAKEKSSPYYEAKLEPLRLANPQAADWFDERKEQFATHRFLDHDVPRFGKVTSNGAENTNSAILNIRSLPITANASRAYSPCNRGMHISRGLRRNNGTMMEKN